MQEKIIILDFGSQTTQLIGRRVRELNMYCEIVPYNKFPHDDPSVIGVILSGSPFSVYDEKAFKVDLTNIRGKYPILGICYGSQLMAYTLGGEVATAPVSEYGHTDVEVDTTSVLFHDVADTTVCWMSHTDYIKEVPEGFRITAHTPVCPVAAMECAEKKLYATQFHPEVMHTKEGMKMLHNFVYDVCGCVGDWKMDSFV